MNIQKIKKSRIYIFLRHTKLYICGILFKYKLRKKNFSIKVMSHENTIFYVKENKISLIRFGDGEINLIAGNDLSAGYQNYNKELADKLITIWNECGKKYLLCLSDIFDDLSKYRRLTRAFYYYHLYKQGYVYEQYCKKEYIYGNTFVTRPYYIYLKKNDAGKRFELVKSLWEEKNIVLVEGQFSRQGVGNDLFEKARSVKRIICPAQNAYDSIKKIEQSIIQYVKKDEIVLISLGPTAKVIIYDLVKYGYWLIDIGHIDSEYEWFRRGAKKKISIENKHTAECNDEDIDMTFLDVAYQKQIIARIGC